MNLPDLKFVDYCRICENELLKPISDGIGMPVAYAPKCDLLRYSMPYLCENCDSSLFYSEDRIREKQLPSHLRETGPEVHCWFCNNTSAYSPSLAGSGKLKAGAELSAKRASIINACSPEAGFCVPSEKLWTPHNNADIYGNNCRKCGNDIYLIVPIWLPEFHEGQRLTLEDMKRLYGFRFDAWQN